MFPQSASSSHTLRDWSDEFGLDQSSCSSNTGDVLIRSTRVSLPDRGHEAGSVQITVRKLRDPPPVVRLSSGTEKHRPKPRQRSDPSPLRAAVDRQAGVRPALVKKPAATKENREPTGTQPPAAELSTDRKHPAGAQSDRQPGTDVLTSRFTAGGRGVVLAALKQRSHSAPLRKEVKVQLLDSGQIQTSSQDGPGQGLSSQGAVGVVGVQMEAEPSSAHLGDATNAAAAAPAAAVVAAAPLIKAQSDMEARVSQLADGVQKLLQADREGGDRRRSLSQQMLQHLEALYSQQLQLQGQLLESALRIVTGSGAATNTTPDLTAAAPPACLQVTHLDATANVLDNDQQSSSATRASSAAAAMETSPAAMATPSSDRWPEQTRDKRYRQGASMATHPPEQTHLQCSANNSQEAVRRPSEVLREMGRLKSEMKMLLTQPEDTLRTTGPPPDHVQSHQNQPQQTKSQRSKSQQHCAHQIQSQSKKAQSHQNHSNQSQCHSQQIQSQWSKSQKHKPLSQIVHSQQSPFQEFQSHHNQSQQSQSQIQAHQTLFQEIQPKQNHNPQTLSHSQQSHKNQSQSRTFQSHQSLFQEIQSQQNHIQQTQSQSQQAQSLLVQKSPVVSSMLEEAGQVLRQVQRQRRVLEENLESLLRAKTGEVLHCQLEALAANRDWTEEVRIKKTVDAWINTLTKDIQDEMSSENTVHHRATDTAVTSQQGASRSSAHPARRRPMNALRGTGSKTAAESRAQTPGHRSVQGVDQGPDRARAMLTDQEQVEGGSYLTRLYGRAPYDGLRRTLKKSPYLRFSSPALPLGRKPRPRMVESVRGVKVKSCKTQTCLAPPISASPVRHHHHTFSSTCMSSVDIPSVPMAIPLGRPRIESSSRCCLSEHQQEVISPPIVPPMPTVVAMDNEAPEQQKVEQLDTGEARSSPHTVDIMERNSDKEEDEDEVFPGTDFLTVADIVQQGVSVVSEEAVELDGGPSPPPVVYQGPVFPPKVQPALPEQGQVPILVPDQQRGALETQLVEWVEQQLMSRMISQMYRPPPSDPAQDISTDQSESEEQSVMSDIVEAAGGGGLQLFVDSNIEVDSALIRQLVSEVLTETVVLMLGQRDALNTEPGPSAAQKDKLVPLVPLVPTPLPTPSPNSTTVCRETTPLTTPPPSEPISLFEESQPITAPEHVATPTPSPEPTLSAGNPPVLHQAPSSITWEDVELPLEEERPEELLDTQKPTLLMSVAEEEPPLSSPHPPPSLPPASSLSPPPPVLDPRPVSPTSSSEDSSSSSSSSSSSISSAVTAGTDAAIKHISEGELLISVNQQAVLTEEGTVCSFSSSLQELQDMDLDPPSEGQVEGHNLLLTKMAQGAFHRGERPQPEGSWGREEEEVSVGEVRDNETTIPRMSTIAQQDPSSSPGQISQRADMSEVSLEVTNQSSVTMGNLMMDPIYTLTSDLQTDLSLSPLSPHLEITHTAAQVVPILLQQNNPQTDEQQEQQQGKGTRRMDVHLPSIRPEEEDVMEESLSAPAATDSSTDDVF